MKKYLKQTNLGKEEEYNAPLPYQLHILDVEAKYWQAFIDARNEHAQSLPYKQQQSYNNATNNLKRNKLWLLKNYYRSYALCDPTFNQVLLDEDCSDKELDAYDFDKAYTAVYGKNIY